MICVDWKGDGKNARQAERRQGDHHTLQGRCEGAGLTKRRE